MTKALCIVAHPDDETIWMSGTIQQNKKWEWTIFSLCRANDKDRATKFRKVCTRYNAKSIISDLYDESDKPLSHAAVANKILSNLKIIEYNYIFTHGENGEYGHIRHKEIHKAVKDLVKKKKLQCEKLFCFDYLADKKTIIPVPNKEADFLIRLTNKQYKEKLKIVTEIYGFKSGIFETMACAKQEAFTLK